MSKTSRLRGRKDTLLELTREDDGTYCLLADNLLVLRTTSRKIAEQYYKDMISEEWGNKPYRIEPR